LALFAAMSILHRRHTPLFCLANLIYSPLHLQGTLLQLAPRCRNLIFAYHHAVIQWIASVCLLGIAAYTVALSVLPPKLHPFTMEVEKDLQPVSAIEFVQSHQLFGDTLTFFDWGQQ